MLVLLRFRATVTRTVALGAAGAVATQGQRTLQRVVDLHGVGATTVQGQRTLQRTASLGALGAVGVAALRVEVRSDALGSISGVTVQHQRVLQRTISLAAIGADSVTAIRVRLRSASLGALGATTVAGQRVLQRSITFGALGATTVVALRVEVRSASLAATGAVAVTPQRTLQRTAALAAVGAVQAFPQRAEQRAVSLHATAGMASAGTVVTVGITTGAAALTGTSHVTAAGQRTLVRTSSLAAASGVRALYQRTLVRAASMHGGAAVGSAGTVIVGITVYTRSAALVGASHVTVTNATAYQVVHPSADSVDGTWTTNGGATNDTATLGLAILNTMALNSASTGVSTTGANLGTSRLGKMRLGSPPGAGVGSGTSLATAIDEVVPVDADFIHTTVGGGGAAGGLSGDAYPPDNAYPADNAYPPGNVPITTSACRIRLGAAGVPLAGTRRLLLRAGSEGGGVASLTVTLRQGGGDNLGGGTLVQQFVHSGLTAVTTLEDVVTGTITDYTDLYVELDAGGDVNAPVDALDRRVRSDLAEWTNWLQANNVKGVVGEFGWPADQYGAGDAARWNTIAEGYYRELQRLGISSLQWGTSQAFNSTPSTPYELAPYWTPGGIGTALNTAQPQSTPLEAHAADPGVFRGVAITGLEFGDQNNGFSNTSRGTLGVNYYDEPAASFTYVSGRGVKVARIGFKWERMQPTLGAALDATYLGLVQTQVARAKAAGMLAVLDCHNYGQYTTSPGYNLGGSNPLGATGSPATTASFVDLWTRLSTAFKADTGVLGYGIMNEPNSMLPGPGGATPQLVWEDASQQVVTAVRANGDSKLMLIAGYFYSKVQGWTTQHPTSWIVDPANNFMYEAHQYWDSEGSTYGRNDSVYQETYAQALADAVAAGF